MGHSVPVPIPGLWHHPVATTTRQQVLSGLASWVHWYNHDRLHSSIGHLSPVEYETAHYASTRDHNTAAAV
jgi:putative transposase